MRNRIERGSALHGEASPDTDVGAFPAAAPRTLIWAVVMVAVAANSLCLAASHLWVYPDSIDYIRLGAGLADRFDWTDELFLIRTPGYPVFLAIVFRLFGPWSPAAILVLQHAMAVAIAAATAAIAWNVTVNRAATVIAGILCACSLQILSYANLVLTETPYTLTLVLCVYFLVRFVREDRLSLLAAGSLMAGLCYLLRPVGLHLAGACVAALAVALCRHRCRDFGRITKGLVAGLLPAVAVVAPWSLVNAFTNGGLETARCLDYVLYQRAAKFDELDSAASPAVQDIHRTLAEAKRRGIVPAGADYRDHGMVIKAYQRLRGFSLAQCSALMGKAARELMWADPWNILADTLRYSRWMLQLPDPVYRFQAGGAPGINGKRDVSAALFSTSTYSTGPGSWEDVLAAYRHYLALNDRPRAATGLWTGVALWFHRSLDQAPALWGLGDSAYEQLLVIWGLALAGSLLTRDRMLWALVALVIAAQVSVSAFLGGPLPRYGVPIRPLMFLQCAWLMVFAVNLCRRAALHCTRAARRGSNIGWESSETAPGLPAR